MLTKNELAEFYLAGKPWVRRLLDTIRDAGGVEKAPAGFLFELRFGYELWKRNVYSDLRYEFPTDVGDSEVDFFCSDQKSSWLIELVGINESETVERMRTDSRIQLSPTVATDRVLLRSDASDERETPGAEAIRVAEKLEGKVWNKNANAPHKFPAPVAGRYHAIVVDMSGFEGIGRPDPGHCFEIAMGSRYVMPTTGAARISLACSTRPIVDRQRRPFASGSTSSVS
jgi:hypothetical protein